MNYSALVCQGYFDQHHVRSKLTESPLLSPLLKQAMPTGYLLDLIIEVSSDWRSFTEVFSPLLRCLVAEVRSSNVIYCEYKQALIALSEMCEIRLPSSNNRPICQLLTEMPEWLPIEIDSGKGGRELPSVSLLGPFLGISVFAEEDPTVAEGLFPSGSKPGAPIFTNTLQQDLEFLRTSLHKLFYAILLNVSSRDAALKFLSECLIRNAKRKQMQVNESTVAGDGFMLNILSVLQHLASKVSLDKIDFFYMFSKQARTEAIGDETRLKMTSQEAEDWLKALDRKWQDPKFPTECWFLTLQAHHISVLPCIRLYQRRLRALKELQKMVEEMERTESQWKSRPMAHRNRKMLEKWKNQAKTLSRSKQCADIGLLDRNLFQRVLQFYGSVAKFLILCINPDYKDGTELTLPLPLEPPQLFAALPEWVVEDIADFLPFAIQYFADVVNDLISHDLMTFLLTAICSSHFFKNPYLVSKLIEVLFVINPSIQDRTEALHTRFMSHPIAEEHLPSALMKFYTGKLTFLSFTMRSSLLFFLHPVRNRNGLINGS